MEILITVLFSVCRVTVLIFVCFPGQHRDGLTSPRSHGPAG